MPTEPLTPVSLTAELAAHFAATRTELNYYKKFALANGAPLFESNTIVKPAKCLTMVTRLLKKMVGATGIAPA